MYSSRLSGHMLSFDFQKERFQLNSGHSEGFIHVDNQISPRTKLGIDNMIKKVLTFQKSQSIDFQYHRTMHFIIFLTMKTV